MAYLVGAVIYTPIEVRDATGAAITNLIGANFSTLEAYLLSSPTTTAPVTLSTVGGGQYAVSFTPSVAGTWVAHAFYTDTDGIGHDYGPESFVVENAPTATVTTVPTVTGATRATITRDVLKDLGDLRILTATRIGSDVIFWDDANLNGEPGAYTGREARFAGGTAQNLGLIRYVSGSANRGIGFGVALGAATQVGDECWLINTRGIGYRFQDVYDAINQAIRDAGSHGLVLASVTTATYTRGTGIALPASFATVEDVQWRDPNDTTVWRSIKKAVRANANGWWVDPYTRTIVIGDPMASKITGRTINVWGLGVPAELTNDTAVTPINGKWLAAAAAATIARGKFMRNPTPETERVMLTFMSESVALRPLIVGRRSPFSEAL